LQKRNDSRWNDEQKRSSEQRGTGRWRNGSACTTENQAARAWFWAVGVKRWWVRVEKGPAR
jgi:hypothetical protein